MLITNMNGLVTFILNDVYIQVCPFHKLIFTKLITFFIRYSILYHTLFKPFDLQKITKMNNNEPIRKVVINGHSYAITTKIYHSMKYFEEAEALNTIQNHQITH